MASHNIYTSFLGRIYFYLYIFLLRAWYTIRPPIIKEIIPPKKSDIDIYVDKHMAEFIKTYDENYKSINYNKNIDEVFYDIKKYQKIVETPNNDIEIFWKRRILFENTPRGNIIMYYDAYKRGFAYYSDQQGIPYSVLNACVMKYVITYRCRDLYMDEQTLPNNELSSIYKTQKQEEKNEAMDKRMVTRSLGVKLAKDDGPSPFAKLKNYSMDKKVDASSNKIPEEQTRNYEKNKILFLGKMVNFSFLQKGAPEKKVVKFKPTIAEGFDGTDTQKEVFNYRDYKKHMLQLYK